MTNDKTEKTEAKPEAAPLAVAKQEAVDIELLPGQSGAFAGRAAFELAQRMGRVLSDSNLVPDQYKGNLPNCIIALEMSQRLGANPLMVMQNLYLVHNKPAWSSTFLIACVNSCGRFSPLRFAMSGDEGTDARQCIAFAEETRSGERLDSPPVSVKMAKDEGWYGRNGSKWKTMPELMLRYRAATLFARLYAPELTMGMRTVEEVVDIEPAATTAQESPLKAGSHSFRKRKPMAPPEVKPVDVTVDPPAEYPQEAAAPEPAEKPAETEAKPETKPAGKKRRSAEGF